MNIEIKDLSQYDSIKATLPSGHQIRITFYQDHLDINLISSKNEPDRGFLNAKRAANNQIDLTFANNEDYVEWEFTNSKYFR